MVVLNDYDVRVVKGRGEFTKHRHPDTDEMFVGLTGSLTIRIGDADVTLAPGQIYVVPRGVEHQPISPDGAEALLVEPSTTINTRDTPGGLTAERRVI